MRNYRCAKKLIAFLCLINILTTGLLASSIDVEAATKKSSSTSYAAGDNIAFGYLDDSLINWTILSYDDTNKVALLISKKTLKSTTIQKYKTAIAKKYQNSSPGYVQWKDNLWRAYLNEIFYKNAFSDTEKEMIQDTDITASSNQLSVMNAYHDTSTDYYYTVNGYKNSLNLKIYNNQSASTDKVFFISFDEYTAYADTIEFGSSDEWPLRTNAYDDPVKTLFVDESHEHQIVRDYHYSGTGIRPAMYVQLGEPESTDENSSDSSSSSSTSSSSSSSTSSSSTSKNSSTASAAAASTSSSNTNSASSSNSSKSASTSSSTSASSVKKRSYSNNGTNSTSSSSTKITLPTDSQYSLSKGGTVQTALELDYLNSTGKNYTVTYKTSDSSVFTVDDDGLITAGSTEGSATLTVRMKKSNGKTYSMKCRIDVA